MSSPPSQILTSDVDAVAAPTQFVETGGRRLAYRSIATGKQRRADG